MSRNDATRRQWRRMLGLGLPVCRAWRDFGIFVRDVGYQPEAGMILWTVDQAEGFRPGTTRWVTRDEQRAMHRSRNRWTAPKGFADETLKRLGLE